jgi:TPR repeat protein
MNRSISLLVFLSLLAGHATAQTAVPTNGASPTATIGTPLPSPTPLVSAIPGKDWMDMGDAVLKARGFLAAYKYYKAAMLAGNFEGEYKVYVMDHIPNPRYLSLNLELAATARLKPWGQGREFLNKLIEITLKSAGQGNVAAADRLWSFYWAPFPDLGSQPDMPQALKWMEQAAHLGDAIAQDHLGLAYEFGPRPNFDLGVPKDAGLAKYWYGLSTAQGIQDAQHGLDRMATENAPMELTGFIGVTIAQDPSLGQPFTPDAPVSLAGSRIWNLPLFPPQTVTTFMPYARVAGRLHWKNMSPQFKVDSVEFIHDGGKHLVDHLLLDGNYLKDRIALAFKMDTPETVKQSLITSIGEALHNVGKDYVIIIKPGMTLKEALTLAVNEPEIESTGIIPASNWETFE